MRIIAIDPGTEQSAIVKINRSIGDEPPEVLSAAILPNEDVDSSGLGFGVWRDDDLIAVEMIASYGMAVGAEVFQTCVWIGQFKAIWEARGGAKVNLLFRRDVKLELCGSPRAKDANIRAALIDLYGPGKERAIGLKKTPGPLYGFKADLWQALGVAVTFDRMLARGEIE